MKRNKFKDYIMGWVIGIDYHDGGEWLYSSSGLAGMWGRDEAKVYKSKLEAEKKALKIKGKRSLTDKPLFIRQYIYSTPNPKNAKGMKEVDSNETGKIYIK